MDNNKELNGLMQDYWEFVLKNNPAFATYIGDHRYDDRLEDLSEEAVSAQTDYFKELTAKIEKLEVTLSSDEDKLNCNLLKNTLNNHIQFHTYKTHYIPLDQMQGPHIDFPQLTEFHPFEKNEDVDNYIARLNAFPRQVEQVIELFQNGIKHKITAFKKVMQSTLEQVKTFTEFSAEVHPLYEPVLKYEHLVTEQAAAAIKGSINNAVTPAYKKLHEYLKDEYMRHCRDEEGIWALPDGEEMYRFYTRYHTTTDLSPEEIHDIGRAEVKRIGEEIRKVMDKLGFNGSIRGFTEYLKNKNELYPENGEEIIDGYRKILEGMDRKLPEYFGRLPRAEYDIKAIEKYREQSAPAAYYYPPPKDFSRPGYFYANTYKPEQRPLFFMEALAYHEAVPGHHLQIALMQEHEGLPEFRKYEGSTAYIEGWALYAEKLAGEMGFYRDDHSVYGRLNFEIWRAVRLVVDTGLHHYKWGRDDAIRYCLENSGEDEHEIEVEVDRYIAMPGQALAYKTGELKILELRERAGRMKGPDFDIRSFHDRLLQNGALPLYTLETLMNVPYGD